MINLSERILGGFELLFWRLTVQLLSIARPITKGAIIQAKGLRDVKVPLRVPVAFPFGRNLISALFGWAIGMLLGYLLAIWIF